MNTFENEQNTPKEPVNLRSEEHFGELQRVIDTLFADPNTKRVERLDVILQAEANDIIQDLQDIVELLPPGIYTRNALVCQLNSTLAAHGWGRRYGILE